MPEEKTDKSVAKGMEYAKRYLRSLIIKFKQK